MAVITPPPGLRLRSLINWRLETATPSSGPGMDGRQQFIRRENRTWTCSYQVLGAWEGRGVYLAFLDQLAGAANTFTIPVFNFALASAGQILFVTEDGDFLTEDDNFLVVGEDRDVDVTAAAPEGALQVSVDAIDGLLMQPGVAFSYEDFLYRISSSVDGTVRFSPPLRTAIPDGATLSVTSPRIRVRLPDDRAAEAAHQFSQRRAPYTLSVIEAFDR